MSKINVIGAGLAGSEAAYWLAERGHSVRLHEMRPQQSTEAHKTGNFAELVCSNSFKTLDPVSLPGLLKMEMRALGSLILQCADVAKVPGGQALTVDRDVFSATVSERLRTHPLIECVSGEVVEPSSNEISLIATGPLTSKGLTDWLQKQTGDQGLYFYDAIAPIVDASTLDPQYYFAANRYDKGEEVAYLNCVLTQEEYLNFIEELRKGETVPTKNFEKEILFQGCQPIESIAATGVDTLRFGPMKPVGLTDPTTGKRPYAVIQLRPENHSRSAYNLVGFQTKLRYPEQVRIFKMIPALKNAEFLRMGSIHRNTFVNGPKVLNADLSLRSSDHTFLAGQITGVEGYLESSAGGLLSALSIDAKIKGRAFAPPSPQTALGALYRHIALGDANHYQPMNACFALFKAEDFPQSAGLRKDALRTHMVAVAQENFQQFIALIKNTK